MTAVTVQIHAYLIHAELREREGAQFSFMGQKYVAARSRRFHEYVTREFLVRRACGRRDDRGLLPTRFQFVLCAHERSGY